jgi:precorrin-4/cobalt-precorrin-4 C11-methyltransferase
MIIRATLSTIAKKVRAAKLTRTALILVGPVLDASDFRNSALYDADHEHVLRNRKTPKGLAPVNAAGVAIIKR